ncbi:phosphodiesterase [Neosynechococcus sphagnicola sy1]|uniref:Phosphodiesterase n=1 Tax=Neosynechococcus sphagnicola sy1 TaxID=1497020 RepID=A0A098TSA9_9CYAN|nr:alkaline phosphatase family protein [Neosynechococcus sphagnicola]KGF73633.1 phosphodiesterase [Neosynechococcus sphagnicola sy1]
MNKVLMIGLDGATYTLLNPMMENGIMPFMNKFLKEGVYSNLMSTRNPLTPPAWTSMITGRDPDAHGIYDFLHPESSSNGVYLKLNDSRNIRCETLWSMASRQGKKVTSLNFYGMSPPFPIDGYLISGFVPWKHLRSATHPPTLFETLKSLPNFNYKHLGMDISDEKKCIQGLGEDEYENWIFSQLNRTEAWSDLLSYLMKTDPTDLTAIVFDGPDKLQHLFWRYLDPQLFATYQEPLDIRIRQLCLDYYKKLDSIIENLVSLSGSDTNVIFTSDHGFGSTTEVVYINEWLSQNGYLKWADSSDSGDVSGKLTPDRMKEHMMMIDWKNTLAYCPSPSSNAIYVLRNDDSNAGVKNEEYAQFCSKLKQQLKNYKDPSDGKHVFVDVDINRKRIEGLPTIEYSPDITLKLRDGGFVSIVKSTRVVTPREKPEGTHRPNGIFIARGPDIKTELSLQPLSILDITPLLLYLLRLPISSDLEGRLPVAVINEDTLSSYPVQYDDTSHYQWQGSVDQTKDISEEEKDALMNQLKLLGYMD